MTHRRSTAFTAALLTAIATAASAVAAEPGTPAAGDAMQSCPLHAQHMAAARAAGTEAASHHEELDARGDQHMGFRQDATTHHFLLAGDGGAVQVTAKDPADAATVAQVRGHLRQIAAAFAAGDFSIPEAVHAAVPPGSREMAAAGEAIAYAFEEIPDGARVRMTARTEQAREAVHEFLRFQIADHGTGDPTTVP